MTTGANHPPDSTDRDAVLVARIRAGDAVGAAAELVQAHEKKLFRVIFSMTTNQEEARDICQITLLEALQRLGRLKDPQAFGPWLLRIGRNRAIDALRARKSQVQRDAAWLAGMDQQRVEVDLGRSLDQLKCQQVIQQKLGRLPGLYRAILNLYYWQDQSIQEIAGQLDLPNGTVKSYLHRARQILSGALDRELL